MSEFLLWERRSHAFPPHYTTGPDRGLVAGMTFWGKSRAATNKVITDDLALF